MTRKQGRARRLTPWSAPLVAAVILAASAGPGADPPSARASAPASERAAAQTAPPNILFILLDDMRVDGMMEVPEVIPKTKRWLADGGTTFTQGFVISSLCCPERATLWSGRVPHNHRVFDNYTGDNLDHDWIASRYLRDAGYRTGLIGKFITDWKFRYAPPHFDDYAAFQGGYVDARFWVKDPGDSKHRSEKAGYSTDFIADKAVEFIKAYHAQGDQPWFMHVSPHAPHSNQVQNSAELCDAKTAYTWRDEDGKRPIPRWRPSPAVTVEGGKDGRAEKADKAPFLRGQKLPQGCGRAIHEGHVRTLMAADDMVDRMMKALEATGQLANTLVIFTSDNGYAWGERGVASKGLPYSEHVLVPFLARWDGVFPAGTVDTRLVSGEDMLPTYLDAAGYQPPKLGYPLDGRSFLPGAPARDVKYLEFGPVGRSSPEEYQGHRKIPSWASLRTADWQYLEYYEKDNRSVAYREYYDLKADPWQLDNVLAGDDEVKHPDVTALSAQLQRLWSCVGTTGKNPCP